MIISYSPQRCQSRSQSSSNIFQSLWRFKKKRAKDVILPLKNHISLVFKRQLEVKHNYSLDTTVLGHIRMFSNYTQYGNLARNGRVGLQLPLKKEYVFDWWRSKKIFYVEGRLENSTKWGQACGRQRLTNIIEAASSVRRL